MVLFFFIIIPVDSIILDPLEKRFPPVKNLPNKVDGIIALGGSIDLSSNSEDPFIALNHTSERIFAFISLEKKYPEAKLCFTGGSGSLFEQKQKEAYALKKLLKEIDFDTNKVIFENRARNTYENAKFSKELLNPQQDEIWLLITSASHMPRAFGVFRRFAWEVIPYPVDFNSVSAKFITRMHLLRDRLNNFSDGLKEWFGLLYYKVMGYSKQLFPKPH